MGIGAKPRAYDQAIEKIIDMMHRYEIREGGLNIKFLDREDEAREILGHGRGVIEDGRITILYGPKGCGKTTLFTALLDALNRSKDMSIDSGVEIHYVIRHEVGGNIIVMSTSKNKGVFDVMVNRIRDLFRGIQINFNPLSPLPMSMISISMEISRKGRSLSDSDAITIAMEIVDGIASKGEEGTRHVVVVDGYRLSSDLDYSSLKGHVEVFYNRLVHIVNKLLSQRGISLAYIITTSDASIERLMVSGSKERYVLIWNLSREAIERLAENVGVDKELAWKLTGGNPRALIDIKTRGSDNWIRYVIHVISSGLVITQINHNLENYLDHVRKVDADPDKVAGSRDMFDVLTFC
ncbi:MAG: ATP-binding protein [Sulfolobales archaeon]